MVASMIGLPRYMNRLFKMVASRTPARKSCRRTIVFVPALSNEAGPSTLAVRMSTGALVLHSDGLRSTKWSMMGIAGRNFGTSQPSLDVPSAPRPTRNIEAQCSSRALHGAPFATFHGFVSYWRQ